jgi:oxygen-independent coproporphyrinogen-3 oxidase
MEANGGGQSRLGMSLVAERRVLSEEERLQEALFTGLRLTEGVDFSACGRRYGVDVWNRYGTPLEPFLSEGLVVADGNRVRLSREGMLLANEVLQVFV